MKRLVFIIAVMAAGFTGLMAQSSFNCNNHQYCYWNTGIMNFENCKGFEENSLFVVSKDEKSLTYKMESLTVSYSISDKKLYKENDITVYHVISADGNKFVYTFDPKNNEIGVVPDKEEKTVLQIFSIKKD